ncbi:MAG: hypothetical protein IPM77_14065 [Crocinitomicaceae bacterium]|nr:hypothetical protein [Crocinitomicaceae bacterium]
MKLLHVLILVCTVFSVSGQMPQSVSPHHAQGVYGFDLYSSENGLAGTTVEDIFQDSKGYVWVATRSGISRFDGKR